MLNNKFMTEANTHEALWKKKGKIKFVLNFYI